MDKIQRLDRQWKSNIDEFFDKLRITLPKWEKWLKKKIMSYIKWYFCFQPKNNGDLALHIILWSVVTVGIVGWFRIAFGI